MYEQEFVISYTIMYVYEHLSMFKNAYTYLYIFMHEKFFAEI